MPSIQVAYQWLDSNDAPTTGIVDMPEANPGTPSASITLRLRRTQSQNLGPYVPSWPLGPTLVSRPALVPPFDNKPAIVESNLFLGATLWNRGIAGSTTEEGFEMVAEEWLEYSTNGLTWHAIGAGPDEDISALFTVSSLITGIIGTEIPALPAPPIPVTVVVEHYPAMDGDQIAIIYLRLNIPADAVTSGDFRAHLEVFAR